MTLRRPSEAQRVAASPMWRGGNSLRTRPQVVLGKDLHVTGQWIVKMLTHCVVVRRELEVIRKGVKNKFANIILPLYKSLLTSSDRAGKEGNLT